MFRRKVRIVCILIALCRKLQQYTEAYNYMASTNVATDRTGTPLLFDVTDYNLNSQVSDMSVCALINWHFYYVPFQLIYGYVETDDDNDDEI